MTDIIGIMRPKKNNNEISSPPTITPTSFPSSSEGGHSFPEDFVRQIDR